jgi:cyanate permease
MSMVLGLFTVVTTPGPRDESAHKAQAPEIEGADEVIEGLKDWSVRRALTTPQFYVIFGGYTTYLLINTTAHGFAVEHLIERHVDASAAALMLSLEALVGVATSVIGGVLGEKVSAKTLMICCLVAVAIGMAALTYASGWGLMLVYALGVGLGFGLSFIAPTILLLNYFGKKANLELFSIMCLLSTVAAAGPAIGGWARDTQGSFTLMFVACTAITVAMLVATIFLKPPVYEPAALSPRLKGQTQ